MFNKVYAKAKQYFPKLEVKYKNESSFMKFIGTLLFFNSQFMNGFVTTIGDTVYFPSKEKVKNSDIGSSLTLLHELVHVYDNKRLTVFFPTLYLMPQLLCLLGLVAWYLVSWKFALLFLLFLAPIPAWFRSHFEKRAYTITLYAMHRLSIKHAYNIDLDKESEFIVKQFTTANYYFMWPFKSSVEKYFKKTVSDIRNNEKPNLHENFYNIIDDIIDNH